MDSQRTNHVSVTKDDMISLINYRVELMRQQEQVQQEVPSQGQLGFHSFIVPTTMFIGIRPYNFDSISSMITLDDKNRQVVQLPFFNSCENAVKSQNYRLDAYVGGIPRANKLIGASTRKSKEIDNGNPYIFYETFNINNEGVNGYDPISLRDLNKDEIWFQLVDNLRSHYMNFKDDETAYFNKFHVEQIFQEDYHIQLKRSIIGPMFPILEEVQDSMFFQPAICMYGGGVERVVCPFSYATMIIEDTLGRNIGKVDFPNMYGSESITYEKSNPEQDSDKLVGVEYRKDGSIVYVRIAIPDTPPTIRLSF